MGLRLPQADMNFGIYTDARLIAAAQSGHDGLVAEAVAFPAPPITVVAFQTLIDDYVTAAAAAVKGSKAQTADKKTAKTNLINGMRSIITYVNMVVWDTYNTGAILSLAQARQMILSTGFKVSKDPAPAGTVVGLRIPIIKKAFSNSPGTLEFLLKEYEKPKRGKKIYQVEVRTMAIPAMPPDPAVPAGPWEVFTFTSRQIKIEDLQPGMWYEYKIAAIGGRNIKLNQENPVNFTEVASIVVH